MNNEFHDLKIDEIFEKATPPLEMSLKYRAVQAMTAEATPRSKRLISGKRRVAKKHFAVAAMVLVLAGGWLSLQGDRETPGKTTPCAKIKMLPKAAGGPGMAVLVDPLLVSDVGRHGISWWQDGNSITYTSAKSESDRIMPKLLWRLDLETGEKQLLADASTFGNPDSWILNVQVSSTGHQVAFMDSQHVRVLDVETGKMQIVPNSFGARHTSWSPDGAFLIFSRSHHSDVIERLKANEKRGLWIWSAKTTESHRIVALPPISWENDVVQGEYISIVSPRWSPDGQWIAYIRQKEEREGNEFYTEISEMCLVRPDGSDQKHIVTLRNNGILFNSQCWSPDSKQLAFTWVEAIENPKWEWNEAGQCFVPKEGSYISRGIMTLDIESGEMTNVVPLETFGPTGSISQPVWSPRSEYIAFTVQERNGPPPWRNDIYIASTKDGTVAPVTTTRDASSPQWSPDGMSLLYFRGINRNQSRSATDSGPKYQHDLWLVELGKQE